MREIATLTCVSALFFLSGSALGARSLSPEENETLCERYGESLERKFSENPQQLIKELDELIVKIGSLGPDRVNHDKSGRMLASIAGPGSKEERKKLPTDCTSIFRSFISKTGWNPLR